MTSMKQVTQISSQLKLMSRTEQKTSRTELRQEIHQGSRMSVRHVTEDVRLESSLEDHIPLMPILARPPQTSRQSSTGSRMSGSNLSINVISPVLRADCITNNDVNETSDTNFMPTGVNNEDRCAEEDQQERTETGATGMGDSDRISLSKAKEDMDKELRDAIYHGKVDAVRQLLSDGAPLTYRDCNQLTPLHHSVLVNCFWHTIFKRKRPTQLEIIRLIVAAAIQTKDKSEILDSLDGKGQSPLYLAIECGSLDVTEILLKGGANVKHVSKKNETALHRAVKHIDILKYFLDNYDMEFSADVDGYTLIHKAAEFNAVDSLKLLIRKFGPEVCEQCSNDRSTVMHVAAEYGSYAVAEYLLRKGYHAYRDVNGETPLYRSVKQGHKSVTALLLKKGAVLSEKDSQGITAAEQIIRKFAYPKKFFEDVFDESINEVEEPDERTSSIVLIDYDVLTDNDGTGMSQIKVVEELVRCGLKEILIHPLIESLLYLKWRCLLPAVYALVVLYAIFLISLNAFVVTMFYKIDYYNTSYCTNSRNETTTSCFECFDGLSWTWIFFIYLSICLLLVQEYIHIYLKGCPYLAHRESCGKLILLVLAAVVPACMRCSEPAPWLRHTASATLLLSWVQAMLLLSRFPDWGYYVLMFERVFYNIFKILLTSICLVIGFSFCFMIEYHSESPFDGPIAAFVKTIVMMSSEFDYEDLFGEDHNTELQDTKSIVRLLFVLFVIFIAIVLMNFMIGVAVSDINELNNIGNIRRLEKQLELQSTLDSLTDLALQKIFNTDSFKNPLVTSNAEHLEIVQLGILRMLCPIKYHDHICKDIESDQKWKVHCRISNCVVGYEQRLSPELQNQIIHVARAKVQKTNISNMKNEKENKFNAMYNTLIGASTPVTLEDALTPTDDNNPVDISELTLREKIHTIGHSCKIMEQSINVIMDKMNLILERITQLENQVNAGLQS